MHTRTRQNDFVFFRVREIPLRFICLNVFSSAPTGRIYPIFILNSKFWAAEFFSARYQRQEFQFSDFFGGQEVYF